VDYLMSHYWANKAALLDPRCYEYVIGDNWIRTVPAGETWFALNLWWLDSNPGAWWFHRPLDVNRALALPAGAVLKTGGGYPGRHGFAYYARPKMVFDIDARYTTDPEGLYYERLERLESLPIRHTNAHIPAGSNVGAIAGKLFDWGDTETQYGILRHVSTHDIAWTILVGNKRDGVYMDAMNTLDEVSDSHTIRFAESVICPFSRSLWNGIWAKSASYAGDYSSNSSNEGHAVVSWSKLPADW
jgi:hypothetical protein